MLQMFSRLVKLSKLIGVNVNVVYVIKIQTEFMNMRLFLTLHIHLLQIKQGCMIKPSKSGESASCRYFEHIFLLALMCKKALVMMTGISASQS